MLKFLPVLSNQQDIECGSEEEYLGLQTSVHILNTTIGRLEESIASFTRDVNNSCIDQVNVLQELESKLDALLSVAENDTKLDDEDIQDLRKQIDGEDDEEYLDDDPDEAAADSGPALSEKELTRLCASVFRSIAKLTHPDIVKHNRYSELFMAANKARAALDLEELTNILATLEGEKKKGKVSLMTRILFLRQQKQDKEDALKALQEHPIQQLRVLAGHFGYDVAVREYRVNLYARIRELRWHIQTVNQTVRTKSNPESYFDFD